MKQENSGDSKNFQIQANDGSTVYAGTNYVYNHPTNKLIKPVNRIPHQGTSHFVGRNNELALIHEKFHQQQNTVIISALGGMGGVGKTELAVKYARTHQDDYSGGICWFNVRSSNIVTEILTFAKNDLRLEVPQKDYLEQPLTLKQ